MSDCNHYGFTVVYLSVPLIDWGDLSPNSTASQRFFTFFEVNQWCHAAEILMFY